MEGIVTDNMTDSKSIIVFDGYCNFCSGGVNFILKRDKNSKFLFAANQSVRGRQLVTAFARGTADSVLLIERGKCFAGSTAVLRILSQLGFPWNIAAVFLVIPVPLRDFVYNYIAARRYRWWGQRSTCRVPAKEEQAKFLA